MEGIYKRFDENGNEHFYFNASHIQTGSLDGGLINGIGLDIKDDITGESIFHVYKDENGTQKDRTLKTAKKLCKRIIAINHIDRYVSNKQMTAETEYPPTMCNMFMRWGDISNDGKKFNMLEFELSPIDSDSKRIERLYQYEVDCDEISAKSHSGEIRTLGRLKQMIVNDGNPMSVTKLFDRKEEETESIDDLIDKDFLDLLDSLISF